LKSYRPRDFCAGNSGKKSSCISPASSSSLDDDDLDWRALEPNRGGLSEGTIRAPVSR